MIDSPFQSCTVAVDPFFMASARELLQYCHAMACIVLDLNKLEKELREEGLGNGSVNHLSSQELEHLNRLNLDKRRREWLGGRYAAKQAAAEVLAENGTSIPWTSLAIKIDDNGRPFLAAHHKIPFPPDISISHSFDLAAAFAVGKGFCGVDIQKMTAKTVKVRERFCSPGDAKILRSFFNAAPDELETELTQLWAAKEALRKAANKKLVPGFLEFELAEIKSYASYKTPSALQFKFLWQDFDANGFAVIRKIGVAVYTLEDYALALTVWNDTLG